MRLIDADALKENRLGYSVQIDKHTGKWPCVLLSEIGNAPTIDAVPVDMVAEMLCHAVYDECPCNYSGADEWLPEVCELQDECPNPKDRLGCWKQYIKHFGERKE